MAGLSDRGHGSAPRCQMPAQSPGDSSTTTSKNNEEHDVLVVVILDLRLEIGYNFQNKIFIFSFASSF